MPATRTASSSHKGQSKPKARQPQPTAPDAAPGVQKIKSSLRQTRRLLAKVPIPVQFPEIQLNSIQDNLAADVRVETERRLKSLQADLETAEVVNKERAVAVRYHKIKFFGESWILDYASLILTRQFSRETESPTENHPVEATIGEIARCTIPAVRIAR